MNLCVVSFKECWADELGRWYSDGGFPLQMEAIGSLFDDVRLVIVRTAPKGGGIPLPAKAEIVPLERPKGIDLRRKISVLLRLPKLLGVIGRECARADAVHIPVPGDISLLGLIVALILRKKLIVRYGGSWRPTEMTTATERLTKWLMLRFSGGRNVMFVPMGDGSHLKRGIHGLFTTALSAQELMRNPVTVDRAPGNPPRLIFIGRLSEEKGVRNLLLAMGRLKTKGTKPMPVLRLVGDGAQRSYLESIADELDLDGKIRFEGYLDRTRLGAILSESDVCVQPSYTEGGYCKAWLDAMARGVPVLASDVGAARVVIGEREERGWLVPPGDVGALARKIEEISSGGWNWQSLRRDCRAFVEDKTLERWSETIGRISSTQWGKDFINGKIV